MSNTQNKFAPCVFKETISFEIQSPASGHLSLEEFKKLGREITFYWGIKATSNLSDARADDISDYVEQFADSLIREKAKDVKATDADGETITISQCKIRIINNRKISLFNPELLPENEVIHEL